MKRMRHGIGLIAFAVLLVGSLVLGSLELKAQEQVPLEIKSYEELLSILQQNGKILKKEDLHIEKQYVNEALPAAEASSSSDEMITKDYAKTNLQVSAVDESDILKTDGRYIYIKMDNNKIAIVDTKDSLKTLSVIEPKAEGGITFNELFIDGNYLVVTGNKQKDFYKEIGKGYQVEKIVSNRNSNFGVVWVYNMQDKSSPKLLREVEVEGTLTAIRKIDKSIYLITNKYTNHVYENEFSATDILPFYKDSQVSDKMQNIQAKGICYLPWTQCNQYTVMTTFQIDTKEPAKLTTLLGDVGELYMNEQSLYLVDPIYHGSELSYITKWNVMKDQLKFIKSTSIPGTVLNQFSMDEYKGNFRVATTSVEGNAVYSLNDKLEVIGKVEGLAKGERIYSVRFDKERAYVVTFQQVDPLFVIDFSNPNQPKVLGELKIPGFSQYLHPVGDNLVVGLGRSTAEVIRRDEKGKEKVIGVSEEGIKLSLFDVTNPAMPKEINNIILGVKGSESEALYNHKAVMTHPGKNLLAMPVSIVYDDGTENFEGAYVFGIENRKLVGKAKLGQVWESVEEVQAEYYYNRYNTINRVCYIGDKLYYLYGTQINEYSLDKFNRQQTLILDK